MASSDAADSGKAATTDTESAPRRGGGAAPVSYFHVDFFLRLLLFAATVSALVVLVTSKQNKLAFVPTLRVFARLRAKFNDSPALIYLLAALAVGCFHSLLTLIISAITIVKSAASAKLLFHLLIFDALMLGVMASATGTGAAVAYIGFRGNSHVRWNKICGTFDMFCRYIASAIAVSLVASVLLVALIVVSSYSLYRRSR
ncbi:unnamed protein product [Spirodela intermedia]|uniref:CASP-like protein n=2 Tax=Spirodela intermedia TaxID=51605 RepID=A0A7I8JXX7_SPIIN|nr:unnamed protein product [Spirodela intermedia]CAA6654226.1 unnamed protein product [Spirodela intermedia]CAA7388618.1 unnamed protein product [Spirodela intermedia]